MTAIASRWLLELLDCPEVQRLRRIHQLGLSYLTYPGADHNRLTHSLGVVHLMQQALQHLGRISGDDARTSEGREPLLAAAMIHDIGHGPFSHLAESCLGVDHEAWTKAILLSEEAPVHRVLRRAFDSAFPRRVAELIDKDNHDQPAWQKYLLSSQLDMDRLDYLRRDSLLTGAGHGHFDWYRLLNTFEIYEDDRSGRDIVWSEKSLLAIEEYIFARYYMYQNVYLHKTTARLRADDRGDLELGAAVVAGWPGRRPGPGRRGILGGPGHEATGGAGPTVPQYLAIEEFTVLSQIQNWASHPDRALGDLARRFLDRRGLAMIEGPDFSGAIAPNELGWETALRELVGKHVEYDPPEMYCLVDRVRAKDYQPYFPEKESDEQSVNNAIRVKPEGESRPIEVSKLLRRLEPRIEKPADRVRYYIPKELQAEAKKLRAEWR